MTERLRPGKRAQPPREQVDLSIVLYRFAIFLITFAMT
jgi:hypothetical protein